MVKDNVQAQATVPGSKLSAATWAKLAESGIFPTREAAIAARPAGRNFDKCPGFSYGGETYWGNGNSESRLMQSVILSAGGKSLSSTTLPGDKVNTNPKRGAKNKPAVDGLKL